MCKIYGYLVVLMSLCLAGCGGEGRLDLNLVPVQGTVTLDGSPLANKSLMFTPESGDGVAAGGNTDASGNYTLVAVVPDSMSDQQGVPPGRYKVTVFEPMTTFEGVLVPGKSSSTIPQKYRAQETTDVVVTVSDAGGTIDIKLSSGS